MYVHITSVRSCVCVGVCVGARNLKERKAYSTLEGGVGERRGKGKNDVIVQ